MNTKIKDFCEKVGIEPNDTCYWDVIKEELVGSQRSKALKFNRLKLVQPNFDGTFTINHLEGYNKTDYRVVKEFDGWHCPCQFHVKEEKDCSHIIALALFLRNAVNNDGELSETN